MTRHGIYVEAHSQNILVRVNLTSKEITGFALRDFDGIGIHPPTFLLRHSDNKNDALSDIPASARNLNNDLYTMCDQVHHALLQAHVGHLLYMLGLESKGGWRIVREELERALNPSEDPDGRLLYDYWMKDTMASKSFLEMRLRDAYAKVSFFHPFFFYSSLCRILRSIASVRYISLMLNEQYYKRELPNILLRDA